MAEQRLSRCKNILDRVATGDRLQISIAVPDPIAPMVMDAPCQVDVKKCTMECMPEQSILDDSNRILGIQDVEMG